MAIYTNSNDNFTRTVNVPGYAAYTLAGWFYWVANNSSWQAYFGLGSSASDNDTLMIYSGDDLLLVQAGAEGGYVQANIRDSVALGWSYMAMTRSGTILTGYTRYPSESTFTSAFLSNAISGVAPTRIEIADNAWSEAIECRMAAIKMWTAALTADELFLESQQYLPVRTANLTGFYPMLSMAEHIIDFSGQGNTLSYGAGSPTSTTADGPPIPWAVGHRRRVYLPSAVVSANDLNLHLTEPIIGASSF